MTTASPQDDPLVDLVRFVRADGDAILSAWQQRLCHLPPSEAPSLSAHGARVLEWLASSLEVQAPDEPTSSDAVNAPSFSAPRAIAELALLTDTIHQLRPSSTDGLAGESLHRVIDAAITESLAREGDESARLRKRLRLATDVTLVGSWEIDPVSGVALADARSRELFGLVDGQLATVDSLTSSLHAADRERVRTDLAQALRTGRAYMDDCRAVRPGDGAVRWIAIAAAVHRGAHTASPRVLGIVHDITDRKQTEEEHARVVEQLSRAVHISEMFVAILSHDLRNPLSAILAGAHILRREVQEEKAARVLSRVVSSGERMGRMIEQLLDFTRARLGDGILIERAAVDLAALAREAVEEGRAVSPAAGIQLATEGVTVGIWDRDRVCQVLSNLVGNAVQHGDPARAVEVLVDGTAPDSVELSVRNGGAIPSELVPVIFNPFRGTLQKRGKPSGLGLGLYVARQIALAHGGDLEVESTASSTVFKLRLPRSAPVVTRLKQDVVREEELAAFERMAAPLTTSAVTAQLFGATSLDQRAPFEHADILQRYGALLDTALNRKAYRGQGEGLAADLRALAEQLGDLGAGPREVTEVHARALRHAVRGVTAAKTLALVTEGRLLALELMGNLASYYRRRSRVQPRAAEDGKA